MRRTGPPHWTRVWYPGRVGTGVGGGPGALSAEDVRGWWMGEGQAMWSQGPHAGTPFSRNRVATKPFIASNAHSIHGCDACEVGGAHGVGKWGVRSVDWVVCVLSGPKT